ncbi:MAG: type ISP restriction/modification enzyme [Treponema sp.]
MSREQKLNILSQFKSMENLPFTKLTPNEHGDWISQRNDKFDAWIPIEPDEKFDNKTRSFFTVNSRGYETARDYWVYASNKDTLKKNVTNFIEEYYRNLGKEDKTELNYDIRKISWSSNLIAKVLRGEEISKEINVSIATYRPFFKQYTITKSELINRRGQFDNFYPNKTNKNFVICTKGVGDKDFSCLISDCIPDLQVNFNTQCFPLYWYETIEPKQHSLFDDGAKIVRHEAISDFILDRARQKYGNKVEREDIFYYVYGILHSKSYRETFCADLKKTLPRIPLVSDYQKFWAFSEAGRKLAGLHLNYEEVERYPGVQVDSLNYAQYGSRKQSVYNDGLTAAEPSPQVLSESENLYDYYAVEQMKFPKKGEKGTILYNHWHTIKNIPEKAYEYVVNGKSAIEWIMERYAVTTDKKSGITNKPNDWSREHKKPRYILDLLLSVINVSVQTVDIVNGLPEVDWNKE